MLRCTARLASFAFVLRQLVALGTGLSVLLVVLASPVSAQPCAARAGCADPAQCGKPSCAGNPCSCGQCQPPGAPQQMYAEEQGAFVAPQQAGTVQGPSRGFGMRGMEIEFPAFRLALPTLRFPSLFRTRANARMLLGSSEAVYVGAGNSLAVGQAVGPAYGVAAVPGAVGALGVQPGAGASLTAEQIRALQAEQAEALRQQMEILESARGEEADAKVEAAEQRLQELQEAERRLDEKIRRLQECLHHLLSAQQQGPAPFCQPQPAPMPPTPPMSFNQPAPLSPHRPLALYSLPMVPQRLPSEAPRMLNDDDGIQAAAYYTESRHLTQSGAVRRLPPTAERR